MNSKISRIISKKGVNVEIIGIIFKEYKQKAFSDRPKLREVPKLIPKNVKIWMILYFLTLIGMVIMTSSHPYGLPEKESTNISFIVLLVYFVISAMFLVSLVRMKPYTAEEAVIKMETRVSVLSEILNKLGISKKEDIAEFTKLCTTHLDRREAKSIENSNSFERIVVTAILTFGIGLCIAQLNNTSQSTGLLQIVFFAILLIVTAYSVAKVYQAVQVFRNNDLYILETMISDLLCIAIKQRTLGDEPVIPRKRPTTHAPRTRAKQIDVP